MVSFDAVSLFTKVPITDTLKLPSRHFEDGNLALFKHVTTSIYFLFSSTTFRANLVAMGLPLSPGTANCLMKDFEKKALELATHKPLSSVQSGNL
jgi:hypothetical protein